MAIVDSSALIPLAWVGHLDLLTALFDEIGTTEDVQEEVLVEGKRGTSPLSAFLDEIPIHATSSEAEDVSRLEGITVADASVMLVADEEGAILLANDKGLIAVARSYGVECWWVTTLLLRGAKDGVVTSTEAIDILYDLVNEGMNLHPKVYSRIQKELREFGG